MNKKLSAKKLIEKQQKDKEIIDDLCAKELNEVCKKYNRHLVPQIIMAVTTAEDKKFMAPEYQDDVKKEDEPKDEPKEAVNEEPENIRVDSKE